MGAANKYAVQTPIIIGSNYKVAELVKWVITMVKTP